ncbi:MAG TPA: hypothetical protein VMT94_08130 [Burkholderiales bacterium]|nr:hypothetical protein [Burkholderiales bacterium]
MNVLLTIDELRSMEDGIDHFLAKINPADTRIADETIIDRVLSGDTLMGKISDVGYEVRFEKFMQAGARLNQSPTPSIHYAAQVGNPHVMSGVLRQTPADLLYSTVGGQSAFVRYARGNHIRLGRPEIGAGIRLFLNRNFNIHKEPGCSRYGLIGDVLTTIHESRYKPKWQDIDAEGVIDEWLKAGAVLNDELSADKALHSIVESYLARKRNAAVPD